MDPTKARPPPPGTPPRFPNSVEHRLELWRIDRSNPAVRFDVVSYPAETVKRAHREREQVVEAALEQFREIDAVMESAGIEAR